MTNQPCPFCGGVDLLSRTTWNGAVTRCNNCDAVGPVVKYGEQTREELLQAALDAWNKRSVPEPVLQDLETRVTLLTTTLGTLVPLATVYALADRVKELEAWRKHCEDYDLLMARLR